MAGEDSAEEVLGKAIESALGATNALLDELIGSASGSPPRRNVEYKLKRNVVKDPRRGPGYCQVWGETPRPERFNGVYDQGGRHTFQFGLGFELSDDAGAGNVTKKLYQALVVAFQDSAAFFNTHVDNAEGFLASVDGDVELVPDILEKSSPQMPKYEARVYVRVWLDVS